VDPENPAKYQLTPKKSKFDTYIGFKMLRNENGTPEERKKGMQCCHLLDSDAKINECISDFIRSKTCFSNEFKHNEPNLINMK